MIDAIFTGIVVIGLGMGLFNTVKTVVDYGEDHRIGQPEPIIVFVEKSPNRERVNQCLELFDEPNMVLIERKELVKECVEANLW